VTTTQRGRHRAARPARTWPWHRPATAADPLVTFWASVAGHDQATDPAPGTDPAASATHRTLA
jgi:hypothetical protein